MAADHVEEALPAPHIEILNQPRPFLPGVVIERAVFLKAPQRDLHAGVPLIERRLRIGVRAGNRAVQPFVKAQAVREIQKTIHIVQHPHKARRRALERRRVARLDRRRHVRIEALRRVRDRLPHQINRVGAIARRISGRGEQQPHGFIELLGIVGDLHLQAGAGLARMDRRAGADDRGALHAVGTGRVGRFAQKPPRLHMGGMRAAVAPITVAFHPFVQIDRLGAREHIVGQLVIGDIALDALHEHARAHAVGGDGARHEERIGRQMRHVAVRVDVAAEVVQRAGHERIAPEARVVRIIAPAQIEHQNVLLGRGHDDVLAKRPRLKHPCVVLVVLLEDVHDALADRVQIFRRVDRRIALMERIGRIKAVRAEQRLFMPQERLAQPREQRIQRIDLGGKADVVPFRLEADVGVREFLLEQARAQAGGALHDGRHAQLAHSGDDPAPQRDVIVDPALGQRPAEALDVGQPLPGQKRRPAQK